MRRLLVLMMVASVLVVIPAGSAGASGLDPVRVVNGNLYITGTNGDDQVSIVGELLGDADPSEVVGFNGVEYPVAGWTGRLWVNTKRGNDVVFLAAGAPGSMTILTGPGDDVVFDFTLTVPGDLVIVTGPGSDLVGLGQEPSGQGETVMEGDTRVFTGSGSDEVEIDNATFNGDTRVFTGSGDDELSIRASSIFNGRARFNGQGGTDTLKDDGGTYAVPPVFKNFELP